MCKKHHVKFWVVSRLVREHVGVCSKHWYHNLTCIVRSSNDSEPGTFEIQSRSTSSSIPIAEGSIERNRMHQGRDVELQELGTDKDIGCGGERLLLDQSFMGLSTLQRDRQCRPRPRANPSPAVDDMSAASMIREKKMQSQKGMREIGWCGEEFEKFKAQVMAEQDEWAKSRVDGTV